MGDVGSAIDAADFTIQVVEILTIFTCQCPAKRHFSGCSRTFASSFTNRPGYMVQTHHHDKTQELRYISLTNVAVELDVKNSNEFSGNRDCTGEPNHVRYVGAFRARYRFQETPRGSPSRQVQQIQSADFSSSTVEREQTRQLLEQQQKIIDMISHIHPAILQTDRIVDQLENTTVASRPDTEAQSPRKRKAKTYRIDLQRLSWLLGRVYELTFYQSTRGWCTLLRPYKIVQTGESLLTACMFGNLSTVRTLFVSGQVSALDRDANGCTALHLSSSALGIKAEAVEIVKLLLQNGADPYVRDECNQCVFLALN